MKKLTQERLKELLHYNPDTGVFTWRERILTQKRRSLRGGLTAGHTTTRGYIVIKIDNEIHFAHRLSWFYVYGYFPENEIDHINRIKTDNKIVNLREVTRQCNIRNTGNSTRNTSGVKGVSWRKNEEKWYSQITKNNKMFNLGCYKEFSNAVCARLAAEQCLNWEGCDSSSPAFKYVSKFVLEGLS